MSEPTPKPMSEVIDVLAAGPPSATGPPSALLAKTGALEVRRLTLAQGREIPTHQARGEITVHCIEGRIAFTGDGTTVDLGPGQMIVLAAGAPHSVSAREDATVLVTKLTPP
jgi:quercetin dioxygenase-like cupin family protein